MDDLSVFFAYPSDPIDIGRTIETMKTTYVTSNPRCQITTWKETDITGRFIGTEVLSAIDSHLCLGADITTLNFNVTYEIGYGIGRRRRLILTRNRAIKDNPTTRAAYGVFDTLGYREYENRTELSEILFSLSDVAPLVYDSKVSTKSPIYVLQPKFKTDQAIRMIARVKKARLFYRSFDPSEQPRLSAHDAIRNVAQSAGVLLQLSHSQNADAHLNNLRAAFLAGLSHGMGKVTTILQEGDEPVPLDYRDFVCSYTHPSQMDYAIEAFAKNVVESLQVGVPIRITGPTSLLARMTFGASSAENEFPDLGEYYLQTDAFLRTARGEVRLVVGRKGSGKTALFSQIRDKVRQNRQNIVLDLKPEGYKLKKFKEAVAVFLREGSYEHTIMALWEYLLLLEICYKLLEKDAIPHTRNHHLYEPYRRLAELYQSDEYISEGDFSERMTVLLERISHDYVAKFGMSPDTVLTQAEVTNLIYKHDVAALREHVRTYMSHKGELWVLIDNLDKGWPTHGVADDDLILIRALLEATRKLERDFQRTSQTCHTVVFLRNDVYEMLVRETPDRGKESKVALDWTDADLLREVLRRRIVYNQMNSGLEFAHIWPRLCISHIKGEESSQYLIERSLMRPRCLIDLIEHCRGHAVNLQRDQIGPEDIAAGVITYSSDLLTDIGYEIQDVMPDADEILYAFVGEKRTMSTKEYEDTLVQSGISYDAIDAITDILLWYGFLGVQVASDEPRYIYSVSYDIKRLKVILGKLSGDNVRYAINPAFWDSLEVE